MDQIEGGTLVVNPAPKTEKAKEAGSNADEPENEDDARDLNVIDGLSEGWKLAEVRFIPPPRLLEVRYKLCV